MRMYVRSGAVERESTGSNRDLFTVGRGPRGNQKTNFILVLKPVHATGGWA